MAELHHECGVAGLYRLSNMPGEPRLVVLPEGGNVAPLVPRMLLDLQNRGQLAAGMASYSPKRDSLINVHKDLGSVIEAFRLNMRPKHEAIMAALAGDAAIGHVRYATCGRDDKSYAQPFERPHGCMWKWFAFSFNGQLANYDELARQLLHEEGYHLTRQTDTEVVMHSLGHQLRNGRMDLATMFGNLAKKFDGSYNIIYLNAMGEMAAVRDPLGIRPLCSAQDGPLVGFASESVALLNLGFRDIRDVEPGQIISVEDGELRFGRVAPPVRPAHCFFEWIYFANVASDLDGRSVYQARAELGRILARTESMPIDADTIVVPVPDTAKAAADAMAYELGCPSMEGLLRNRYVGRTFIQGADRTERAKVKYTPLRPVLEGKRVLLVEDTIVRSTTMRSLLHLLREAGGAKEVHVRVACPPIVAPCFYGIDMSTIRELFAPAHLAGGPMTDAVARRMAESLGADSLRYLPSDALATAIGLPTDRLCRACVTGEYPTPTGERLYQLALDRHRNGGEGRTYERGVG